MSKYTTLLRWPIEQRLDDLKLTHTEDNWPQCYQMLGLSDYPIFDESHRQELNDKIIRAYYFREIGFETMGLFAWNMRRTMFEIMPYYNQLYESEKLIVEPLLTRDMTYTENWTRDEDIATNTSNESTSTGHTSNNATTSDKNVTEDTPMNLLDSGDVEGLKYATNVTFDTSETNGSTDTSGSTNSSSDRTEKGGYQGTKGHEEKGFDQDQSELLLTYRRTLINIDLEIVDKVGILFMGLW